MFPGYRTLRAIHKKKKKKEKEIITVKQITIKRLQKYKTGQVECVLQLYFRIYIFVGTRPDLLMFAIKEIQIQFNVTRETDHIVRNI